jgi:hypothetical protein
MGSPKFGFLDCMVASSCKIIANKAFQKSFILQIELTKLKET